MEATTTTSTTNNATNTIQGQPAQATSAQAAKDTLAKAPTHQAKPVGNKKSSGKRKKSGSTGLTPEAKTNNPKGSASLKPAEPEGEKSLGQGQGKHGEALEEALSMLQEPCTPASISDQLDLGLLDVKDEEDLESQELVDLTEEVEIQIGQKAMAIDEAVVEDQPAAVRTYAQAAATTSGKKIRGHEVLYIHQGPTERKAIKKETFYKLWEKLNSYAMEALERQDDAVPCNVLWRSWSEGRGLIAVGDKETAETICKLVGEFKVGNNTFRAWHRGEFGEGHLVTSYLPGHTVKQWKGERIMGLILRQNKLRGRWTGVKLTDTGRGRLLKFFADADLWADLRSRGVGPAGRVVKAILGFQPVSLFLSRPKPPGTAKGTAQPDGPLIPFLGGSDGQDGQGTPEQDPGGRT